MFAVALGAVMVDSHGTDSTGLSYVTISLQIFHMGRAWCKAMYGIRVLVMLKLNVLLIFSHVPTLDITQEYSQNTYHRYHSFHPMNCFFILPIVYLHVFVILVLLI